MRVLTIEQVAEATIEGQREHREDVERGYKHGAGFKGTYAEGEQNHVWGSRSELAWHLVTGLPWHRKFGKGPDVGDWHIRATQYKRGHLLIQDNDWPGLWLLATGTDFVWTFVGCGEWPALKAKAVWAKKEPERPCWWIEQRHLSVQWPVC